MAGEYHIIWTWFGEHLRTTSEFASNAVTLAEHLSDHKGVTSVRVVDVFAYNSQSEETIFRYDAFDDEEDDDD